MVKPDSSFPLGSTGNLKNMGFESSAQVYSQNVKKNRNLTVTVKTLKDTQQQQTTPLTNHFDPLGVLVVSRTRVLS